MMTKPVTPMFFNQYLYSDVKSWMITSISEDGNTCTIIEVKKVSDIEMDFIPGGFMGTVINNSEMFMDKNCHLETVGKERTLTKRNGLWGECYNPSECMATFIKTEEEAQEWISEHGNDEACKGFELYVTRGMNGYEVRGYKLTKAGKRYNRWTKFLDGKIEAHCRYYYDYNF